MASPAGTAAGPAWEVFAFPGNVLLPWVEAAEKLHFFLPKTRKKNSSPNFWKLFAAALAQAAPRLWGLRGELQTRLDVALGTLLGVALMEQGGLEGPRGPSHLHLPVIL